MIATLIDQLVARAMMLAIGPFDDDAALAELRGLAGSNDLALEQAIRSVWPSPPAWPLATSLLSCLPASGTRTHQDLPDRHIHRSQSEPVGGGETAVCLAGADVGG
jgi:hypothetical protein